ncbi:MAG: hypothetical protein A3F84_12905 [Candidatus Handelsmanbacteria bacterium RIFCSPLOWO2_12_FULL_64_10]|uniref:Uncharacterized protein n=1 Tax=Handelsmanbacteria sp. (strain RIFCSPLOWO2_12_FULL_64_10) TaxID=1817868 RepID=A0A1F6C396_HANXR|nr:MAG: hypothetical protein A3F84_12905 [Candidatus Handelsmanbacteria bacterium RIFCSPLOWO2_12_FULL_64_10]
MDYVALQVAVIAVLSPVLLPVRILYLLSTSHIQLTATLLNLMTVIVGALRFTPILPPSHHGFLTFLFVFFLILALVADAQWGRKFLTSKIKAKKAPIRRVKIESQNAWVVHKSPGEKRAYRVPKLFLEKHNDYLWSDLKFRITHDQDTEPIEGVFTINEKFYIILPEVLLVRLQKSKRIRFEIVE